MALTDKERTKLATKAHDALKAAKSKKEVRKVFENSEYGYGVLGLKILGRMIVGKSVEQATAKRGKKED